MFLRKNFFKFFGASPNNFFEWKKQFFQNAFWELYTGDFPIKIGMIFHWMIFDEDFWKFIATSLQWGFFLQIKRFCQIVSSMFLFVGIFPFKKKGIFFCLDAAQRLL